MFRFVVFLGLLAFAVCGPVNFRSKDEIAKYRNFLKDTQNRSPINSWSYKNNPYPELFNGKFQGDIMLDDDNIDRLVEQYATGRNAYIWPGTKWPTNVVPFVIEPGYFDHAQEQAILDGINHINNQTCLVLRPKLPSDTHYVSIIGTPTGCWAYVGYNPNSRARELNLQLFAPGLGCFRHSTIVHEWLHILGFYHMQSTYNRDNYVKIMWENIEPGMEHNFDHYTNEIVNNLGAEYEYTSCMHYHGYGFSINGEPTIVALKEFDGVMGQQEVVTELDWVRLNRHYNCPAHWN